MANVLLHLALGVLLLGRPALIWRKFPVAGVFYLVAAGLGIFLAARGNVTDNRWALNAPHRHCDRRFGRPASRPG